MQTTPRHMTNAPQRYTTITSHHLPIYERLYIYLHLATEQVPFPIGLCREGTPMEHRGREIPPSCRHSMDMKNFSPQPNPYQKITSSWSSSFFSFLVDLLYRYRKRIQGRGMERKLLWLFNFFFWCRRCHVAHLACEEKEQQGAISISIDGECVQLNGWVR